MKTPEIYSIEKSIGLFLIESGLSLKKDIKAKNIWSFILDIIFTGTSITVLINLGIKAVFLIVLLLVIGILLFMFFKASMNFFGSVLESAGAFFAKRSSIARVSCQIIPDLKKYQKAEFFIKITNKEWFSNAQNVKCTIEMGATAQDFEDRQIYESFEKSKEQRYIPLIVCGKWIAENEDMVDIKRNSGKNIRFIRADVLKDEILVFGKDNGKTRDVSLPPRKYIMFVSVNGEIKGGAFSARFQVLRLPR